MTPKPDASLLDARSREVLETYAAGRVGQVPEAVAALLHDYDVVRGVLGFLADEAARACTEPRLFQYSPNRQHNLSHYVAVARQALDGKLPEQGNDPSKRFPEDVPR